MSSWKARSNAGGSTPDGLSATESDILDQFIEYATLCNAVHGVRGALLAMPRERAISVMESILTHPAIVDAPDSSLRGENRAELRGLLGAVKEAQSSVTPLPPRANTRIGCHKCGKELDKDDAAEQGGLCFSCDMSQSVADTKDLACSPTTSSRRGCAGTIILVLAVFPTSLFVWAVLKA